MRTGDVRRFLGRVIAVTRVIVALDGLWFLAVTKAIMKGFPRLTVTLPESSDPSSSPPAARPAIRCTTGSGRLPPARVSPWQPPAIKANAMPAERDAMRGDDDMSRWFGGLRSRCLGRGQAADSLTRLGGPVVSAPASATGREVIRDRGRCGMFVALAGVVRANPFN